MAFGIFSAGDFKKISFENLNKKWGKFSKNLQIVSTKNPPKKHGKLLLFEVFLLLVSKMQIKLFYQ